MLIYSAGWFAHGNDPENTFVIEKTVNQEILTNFDLGQRLSILKIFNVKLDKKQNSIEKLMVDEILQTQFANANGIQLTKNEFEIQLEEFLRLNRINIKELKTILIENSIEWASFEKFLYSKALWKKSLLQRFGKRAMISDFELNLPPSKKKINPNAVIRSFTIKLNYLFLIADPADFPKNLKNSLSGDKTKEVSPPINAVS